MVRRVLFALVLGAVAIACAALAAWAAQATEAAGKEGKAETAEKETTEANRSRMPPCPDRFTAERATCELLSPEMERRFWLWSAARNWKERERQRAEHGAPSRLPTWPATLDELAELHRSSRPELDSSYDQGERERWIEAPVCRVPEGPMHGCGMCAPPESIVRPRARYTAEACRLGIQGIEIFSAVIDRKGRVKVDRLLKGLPAGLEAESRRAIELSLFLPVLHCGEPVEAYFNLTVSYRLSEGCKDGLPID